MNINPHPPTFTLPSILPPLTATVAFASIDLPINQAMSAISPVIATGGNGTYTFAVAPALPAGLSFNTATGQITGTPTILSSLTTRTVTVTDSASQTSATFSLTVSPLPALTTTQAIPATTLTANIAATPFTPVTAAGGFGTLTFAAAPALPAGLILSTTTGQITGTPTATLTATNFTVTVTDSASQTSSKIFSLTVQAPAALTTTQVIAATTLTANTAATPFTPVTAAGGVGTLTFAVAPALPAGLNFNTATGQITGTPTVVSSLTTRTVTVTDDASQTSSKTFNLTVNAAALTTTQAIPATTLTANTAATPFTPVTAAGGVGTLTFAVAPALPAGLNFNTATGQITGTPTVVSSLTTRTVTVTDGASQTSSKTFNLTVNAAALTTTQVIPATTLTQNTAATPFTPVTAAGGFGTLTFAVAPALPAGLSFNTATGQITGTPTATLTATNFTVTVTDGASQTSSKTFSLTVNAAAAAVGQIAYTTAGSYSYTAPAGVTSVSVVCVGGGGAGMTYFGAGGAGGGLAYLNNIAVVPGNTYTVVVGAGGAATQPNASGNPGLITASNGGTSSFSNGTITVSATGGQHGGQFVTIRPNAGTASGTFDGGGAGGTSEGSYSSAAPGNSSYMSSGGGGAGGYSGAGGIGAGSLALNGSYIAATAGLGGGGGGGAGMATTTSATAYGGAGGGGVGILGQGTSGSSGITDTTVASPDSTMGGGGGSPGLFGASGGGSAGSIPPNTNNGGAGGLYGGGGGSGNGDQGTSVGGAGGGGAVRIIWGAGRAFPSTGTGDPPPSALVTTLNVATVTASSNVAISPVTPVTASDGAPAYTFAVAPALPAGLILSTTTGQITGTPTATLTATNFTVTVTDGASQTSSKTFSLTVNASALTTTQVIAATTLTTNTVATPFTPVTAAGGVGTRIFACAPALPTGMSFNTITGQITGTPTVVSSLTTRTVTVTDQNSPVQTSSKTFSLTVNASALTTTQVIAATTLTANITATPFTPVTAAGGVGTLTFAVAPALPTGLNFNTATGQITGTPSVLSSITTRTVTVTDQNSPVQTSSKTFNLTVNAATLTTTQAVASNTLFQNTAATPFTPVTSAGGFGTLTFAVAPALPTGLNFNTATGQITGTPSVLSGATTYTVTVTDGASQTSSKTFSLAVTTAGTYAVTAGTKAPTLGAAAQNPFPAAGWTTRISSNQDDGFVQVNLPFTIQFNAVSYTSFFPGSNIYVTFGSGSGAYASLSASNPAFNKIHIASADNSWQRCSEITSGASYTRFRCEGNASTSGTPGSPGIVYEITFFNPALTGSVPWIEILVGVNNRPPGSGGISGIYSTNALLTGGTIGSNIGVAVNQSYVLVGNATGTSWTVNTGFFVSGTGY